MREGTNFWGDKKNAVTVVHTSNPNIKLELLFETDEFKMYRFVDMAHTRYVAIKKDSASVMEYNEERKGKNVTIHVDNTIESK
jgi:hypothetical protein